MPKDRIARLSSQLQEGALDAFLACTASTMGYLHGLHESGGERLFIMAINPAGRTVLIAPALAETQARRVGVEDVRPWRDGEDPMALFHELAEEWNLRSGILAVDDEMPAHLLLPLQAALPAALFRPGKAQLSALTARKDATEIAAMKAAAAIADQAFQEVLSHIEPGLTELQVDRMLRDAMAARGGTPVFCIVATGAGSAEPHHLSSSARLSIGDVLLLDFGCDVEGYKSDITRTLCVGENPEAREVYKVVWAAHHAARQAAVFGATGEDVDRAARQVIEQAGYGPFFFHRTGHGIGSQVHEEPNMVEGNRTLLAEGNTFSIEPGIYLAGKFGIRIENIVAMTDSGLISLNEEPSAEMISIGAF